jgi:eukaryotic-like serine/threonine-protein kinase
MPFTLTLKSFLDCLTRSGFVDRNRVAALLLQLTKEGVNVGEPRAIAAALVRDGTLTPWQAENLLRGKHRGFVLGKYRLLSLLGRGGMSAVYLAEHSLMRRRCALKILPAQKLGDSSHLARFHREARALAALDHSNIVRAYDVDQALDGKTEVHFFVMEFVEGESLHDRVTRAGPMTPFDSANWIRQAADGLAYAHGSGIVHRDVKPANLLVSRDDVVKILDLGLVKFFDDAPPLNTGEGRVLGTADFLSPEQALDSHAVDARADIYSLGCTFYFLLAGHPPFPAGTLSERLLSHQTKQPVPIAEIRQDVPADLATVLGRMMAKKPANRFQTAGEVSEVLRRWLVRQATPQWIRKNPAILSGAGVLQEAAARRLQEVNASAAEFAKQSAVARKGLTASGGAPQPTTSTSTALHSAWPAETSSSGVHVPLLRTDGSPPPTSHMNEATTVEIDVWKRPPSDRHGSSVIDSRNRRGPSSSRRGRPPNLEVITFCVLSVLSVLGGLAWFATQDKARPVRRIESQKTTQAVVPELIVPAIAQPEIEGDIHVGPRGHFKTIGQAIDFVREAEAHERLSGHPARETRTIKVAGWHTYPERIEIENSSFHFPKGLRIICDDPVPAILAPQGPQPVVRLSGVERFTLEGFELDASGKRLAIELDGYLVGTRLSKLRITGHRDMGILIQGAMGLDRRQSHCILDHLVFRNGAPGAVGIQFASGINPSSNLTIANCRFFGPLKSAITFDGPVVGVEVRESIVTRAAAGIVVQGLGLDPQDLAIVNNTFHRLNYGIVFREMPHGSSSGLLIQRNLFTEVSGAELFVERGFNRARFLAKFAEASAAGNWTSRAIGQPLPDGQVDLFASGGRTGATFRFQSTDPENDRFLWPRADAPHKAMGAVILK